LASEKFDPAPTDKQAENPKTTIKEDRKQSRLDEELEDTFPASDPARNATEAVPK
jgi:hypothetical protein